MQKKNVFILLIFITTISFSQNKIIKSKRAPVSIYTINYKNTSKNLYFSVNKNLNINSNQFSKLTFHDIDCGLLNPLNLFSKKSLAYIEDATKNYQDKHLLKSFLFKNDPTRWPICNFIPRNLN